MRLERGGRSVGLVNSDHSSPALSRPKIDRIFIILRVALSETSEAVHSFKLYEKRKH